MESIRNAATAAANMVGLGGNTEETREGETSRIAGGEAPQDVATGTSQSGVEPVSGKLGRGEAGEPYDAGNLDGASGLGNTSSDYTSTSRSTGTGLGSGLTGSSGLTSSSGNTEPLSEKVRETFGVGGSNKQGTGLGGRNDDPSYGTGSKRDKDSSLGSAVGHGSNPDTYAYTSKTAPGLGGHRIGGDDFTSSNKRNEGRDTLPTNLGSDVAAGRSGGHSSSGGLTGRSGNDRYSSDATGGHSSGTTGESFTQKAKDYLPGTGTGSSTSTSSYSNTQPDSARAAAREVIAGSGRNDGYNSSTNYGSSNTSSLPVRSQDSTLTGDRGLTGSSSTGSGLTGTSSSGLTSGLTDSSTTGISSSGLTGTGSSGVASSSTPGYDSGLTGSHSHSHGINPSTFDQERQGYVPHGGHPIGEGAHSTEDGKQTWLDYRNDPTLPVARAEPADR